MAEMAVRHRLQRPRRPDHPRLRYQDKGRARPILYRASLTEMVVPYGDPQPQQVRKNAFDVGEYGMGMCANSLRLGCDCLGYIKYLDAHLCDSRGGALTIQERHLHARGRLRHPLEAHRPPASR
jgi:Cu2+-containing amine oxidase